VEIKSALRAAGAFATAVAVPAAAHDRGETVTPHFERAIPNIPEALATKLGKSPIVARNTPGFVVNRLLLPMLNEAFFLLAEDDVDPTDIDDAMKLGCNHPIGPLALADLIGLDVLLAVLQTIHDELGKPKYRPAPLLKASVPNLLRDCHSMVRSTRGTRHNIGRRPALTYNRWRR
jgi:hypothetical protein